MNYFTLFFSVFFSCHMPDSPLEISVIVGFDEGEHRSNVALMVTMIVLAWKNWTIKSHLYKCTRDPRENGSQEKTISIFWHICTCPVGLIQFYVTSNNSSVIPELSNRYATQHWRSISIPLDVKIPCTTFFTSLHQLIPAVEFKLWRNGGSI